MKTGKERFDEIMRQVEEDLRNKRDFYVEPNELRLDQRGRLYERSGLLSNLDLNDWALSQLCNKIGIPTRYFKKCPPELQAINANYWFSNTEFESNWLLRTRLNDYKNASYGGLVRGVLTEKYSLFDDHEILYILEKILHHTGTGDDDFKIVMWYRDDTSFHLRIIFKDLTTSVGHTITGEPDIHQVGIHIENSEVGKKSIRITPLIYRLVCSNGLMVWTKDGDLFEQRHIHLKPQELYNRVAEGINNALKLGDETLEYLLESKEIKVEEPIEFIKKLAQDQKYSQQLTDQIIGNYMQEPGDTAFYVVQAFTRTAQQFTGDEQVEMESFAGTLLKRIKTYKELVS